MDIKYMRQAFNEAKKAFDKDEVPIGCVIVDHKTGKIVARAHNSCEERNCLKHAELVAIEKACNKTGKARLWDLDLYVTLEPCTMCAAGISFARIKNLYFGAYDEKGGAVFNGIKFFEAPTCHHKPKVQGGIMEDECSELPKKFFQTKRKK